MLRTRTRLRAGAANGPLVNLNFLSGSLDSRITFTRGSNATLVDSTGRVTYAPANLFTYSEDFTLGVWSKGGGYNSTITANSTTAPNGTLTADTLVADNSGGTGSVILARSVGVTTGTAYTFSFFAKAATLSWIRLFALGYTTPGNGGAYFNLSGSGSIGTVDSGYTATISAQGDGWYRCSLTFTAGTIVTGELRVLLANANNDTAVARNGTSSVFLWGAQLEQVTYQTTPSTYVATTASAYYGPRFDYDPVTLAPRGLLIEEQRTNSTLYSEQFDNAAWPKQNATVTANATTAPDGTTTADKLVEDATAGVSHRMYQTTASAFANGTTVTNSVFLKAAERTWAYIRLELNDNTSLNAWFNLSTGAIGTVQSGLTATITPFGNGWYRCTVAGSVGTGASPAKNYFLVGVTTADNTTNYTGNGTSGVFLWGAQLEAGAFATSYIPTVASTVTRSADVATMTGTNFSSWYNQSAGTFIAEASAFVPVATTTNAVVSANDNTGSNRNNVFVFNGQWGGVTTTGGVDQANILIGASYTPTAVAKIAYAYQANNFAASVNGGTVGTDVSGTVPTVDRLFLGVTGSGGGAALNGHVRQIAYYNSRLPNAQLQTLTAPTLALPLSLDFTTASYTVGY